MKLRILSYIGPIGLLICGCAASDAELALQDGPSAANLGEGAPDPAQLERTDRSLNGEHPRGADPTSETQNATVEDAQGRTLPLSPQPKRSLEVSLNHDQLVIKSAGDPSLREQDLRMSIQGPKGLVERTLAFEQNAAQFELHRLTESWPDGSYKYELSAAPRTLITRALAARGDAMDHNGRPVGATASVGSLRPIARKGGTFTVKDGKLVQPITEASGRK